MNYTALLNKQARSYQKFGQEVAKRATCCLLGIKFFLEVKKYSFEQDLKRTVYSIKELTVVEIGVGKYGMLDVNRKVTLK